MVGVVNPRLLLLAILFAVGAVTLVGDEPAEKESAPADKEPAQQYKRPVIISIHGMLTPMTERSFHRRLMDAKSRHADLVVIEIDSPGGYVDSSVEIADALLHVDWARTVAYVPHEAMSGAAIVSLGCDDIVIAPNAQYGDAGMIQLSLDDAGFRYAPEKARSALVSQVRTLAASKGRPPALAEAMVDMDLAVYRVRNKKTGAETFMSEAEINSAANSADLEKLKPIFEAREKHFLTLNGNQAVELQLAQALVKNREELKAHYRLDQDFFVLEHRGTDTAVLILNHPLVTGLIFVIGLVALYVEFSFPGTFVGGLIAGLCFAMFFWSRFLGGTAGWLEVILFIAGLTFIGMELFVIPGFGVSGVTGLVLIFISMVMASQTFFVPHTGEQLNTTLTQVGVVSGSGVMFLIAAALVSRYLGVIPVMKSLMLEVPTAESAPIDSGTKSTLAATVLSSVKVAIGEQGIADSPLRPAGKARFGDDFVDVVADGMFVDRGRLVRVVEVSGNRVVVREVET